MKKVPALIVLLALTALSTLQALDIYVNNVLWHSYSDEALDALITEIPADSPPSLPFALLLPLMTETNGMHLLFRGGDARLECTLEELREARLFRTDSSWELDWAGSRYDRPRRAELYGRPLADRELTLWSEPGLTGFEKQILVWSRLHKIELKYREIESIENELIHSRLTGGELPDLFLRFQPSQASFSEEENVAYLLRSVMDPGGDYRRLVVPAGERFHPELFLSLLCSLKAPSDSTPYHRFPADRTSLARAREIYLDLILSHRVVEKSNLSENIGNLYYPARGFPRIPGTIRAIPAPDGRRSLPPRILPLQLKTGTGDFPAESLLDFLRLPGIQHSLLSLSGRQLPARTEILENMKLSPEGRNLYREWCSGYILSRETEKFINNLGDMFPDLYRADGVLP